MNFLDRLVERVRGAASKDEAVQLAKDYLDPSKIGDGIDDDKNEIHLHVHSGQNSAGAADPDSENGGNGNGAGDPDVTLEELAARVAALEQKLAEITEGDEGEVQLEDPDTQDARRYIMRRGKKMRALDQDMPVPERKPEIMGETDLPGVEDLNKRTTDSVPMEAVWQEAVALAEIIVPGVKVPTFDAKHHPTLTAKRLCAFRRTTMDAAMRNSETAAVIATLTGLTEPTQLKHLACDTLKMAFAATGNAIRVANNATVARASVADAKSGERSNDGNDLEKKHNRPITTADINKINREFYKNSGNGARR